MRAFRLLHSKGLNVLTRLVHAADGTAARRAELDAFDYLPREQQEQMVMARLRSLLEHAFTNVPYWAQVARERGLKPDDFQTYADLQKLPVLTKQHLREQRQELIAEAGRLQRVKANHTGGSTGEPVTFFQDAPYRRYSTADKTRLYERCNYRLGNPVAFLWGSDYDSGAHNSPVQHLVDRLGRNLLWINTLGLTEGDLQEYAKAIASHNPKLIVGYAASLTMYARFLNAHDLPAPKPKGIQSSADVLIAADRELLGMTFGCPVFDRYGSREVGIVAHECHAHKGLHVSTLCNIVELLDDRGSPVDCGCVGRVTVTNLHNCAMPLIRYDLGDLSVMTDGPCNCGRNTMRLRDILGRVTDVILSPSGRMLHGELFIFAFYGRDDVKQFQIVQENVTDLTIRLVPREGADMTAVQAHLTKKIHEHADPAFVITFEICEHIEPGPSGKYRFVISKLEKPFSTPEE